MDKSLRSWMGPSTEAIDCFWVVGLVTDLNVKTCATKLLGDMKPVRFGLIAWNQFDSNSN